MTDLIQRYMEFTRSTAIYPPQSALEYLVLGLASEAGEVAGVMKKDIRDMGSMDEFKGKMQKELGDCFWYLFRLADEMDIGVASILETNIEKLSSRQARDVLKGSGDDR